MNENDENQADDDDTKRAGNVVSEIKKEDIEFLETSIFLLKIATAVAAAATVVLVISWARSSRKKDEVDDEDDDGAMIKTKSERAGGHSDKEGKEKDPLDKNDGPPLRKKTYIVFLKNKYKSFKNALLTKPANLIAHVSEIVGANAIHKCIAHIRAFTASLTGEQVDKLNKSMMYNVMENKATRLPDVKVHQSNFSHFGPKGISSKKVEVPWGVTRVCGCCTSYNKCTYSERPSSDNGDSHNHPSDDEYNSDDEESDGYLSDEGHATGKKNNKNNKNNNKNKNPRSQKSSSTVPPLWNDRVWCFDTGVDTTHPDLHVVEARSFVEDESDGDDHNGHGTHVAGTIGGFGHISGVASGVSIHSYKILNAKGEGSLLNLVMALDHLVGYQNKTGNKPIAVNMSLGVDTESTEQNFVDKLITRVSKENNVVFCVAAGNEGVNSETSTPAHTDGVFSVAAYDKQNKFTPWSDWGPLVKICAPGDKIKSTYKGGEYKVLSGTSMATPHVTGAVVSWIKSHPNQTPQQIIHGIVTHSKQISGSKNPTISQVPDDTSKVSLYCDGFDKK